MMNSRERRLWLWSNATCAMPLCEALPSRRGLRAHHAQMDCVGMASDRERAIAAGCDEFETKPVDMPRLLGKIAAFNGHS